MASLSNTLIRLTAITDGCRDDMHEPDEQGLTCRIVGYKLDNALGDRVSPDAIIHGYQEFVVILDNGTDRDTFNLATLIALARKAKLKC